MKAIARLVFDRAYFESNYDAWLRHRAKYRPYAVYLSLTLLTLGVIMAFAFPAQRPIGVLLTFGGIYEWIDALTHKPRWINARIKATRENKTVDMQLSETALIATTSFQHSTIQIEAFAEIIPAANDVFLIPESGVSIYIPAVCVEPADALRPLVDAWMATRRGR